MPIQHRRSGLRFHKTQWKYKQAYALDADAQSRALLQKAIGGPYPGASTAFDVLNTASWPRTDLVTLPKETAGDCVKDESGRLVPSQRLATGELVFLARDVPAFRRKRFTVEAGTPPGGQAQAQGVTLQTPSWAVKLDAASGAIVSLRRAGLDAELVRGRVNNYLYLLGRDRELPAPGHADNAQPNGPAKITVQESGPLVASLAAESDAPGCNKLVARSAAGGRPGPRRDHRPRGQEGGARRSKACISASASTCPIREVRINSPGSVFRPEKDQIPGACKNWFSVERWVDISGQQYGVTWSTSDAPLVELGGLTANLAAQPGRPQRLSEEHCPVGKALLLGDEQPMGNQLPGDQDRPDDVPLCDPRPWGL